MTTTLLSTLIAAAVAIAATAEPRAADGAQTAASKKCEIMQRRIAKEQKSLASFDETIAADTKGRETCASKPMCARYDQAIKTMESRKAQHEARLAKLKTDAENVCSAS